MRLRSGLTALTVHLLLVGLSPDAYAQEQFGPASVLNEVTQGRQSGGRIARDANDASFVVWDSFDAGVGDTDSSGIRGRCFDAEMDAIGAEFQVNSTTSGSQFWPEAARNDSGATVVVWVEDFFEVVARRFDAACAAVGSEFTIASYGAQQFLRPVVGVQSTGSFVVVWNSAFAVGADNSGDSVQARMYDPTGTPLGAAFQVNTNAPGPQSEPSVSVAGDDSMVVVWEDAGTTTIRAQRLDPTGAPVGGEITVGSGATTSIGSGEAFTEWQGVAHFPSGGFVVAWRGANTEIQARRYDSAGSPLAAAFGVSALPVGVFAIDPVVDTDSTGGFVAAWLQGNGVLAEVRGQRFDASGAAVGGNFLIAASPVAPAAITTALSFDSSDEYIAVFNWSDDVRAKRSGMPSLPAFGGAGRLALIAGIAAAGGLAVRRLRVPPPRI